MLVYVISNNIDSRVLKQAADLMSSGGLVAFPTDTSWSIGCSIQSKPGIAKLKVLKGSESFTPTIICSEIAQISDFVNLDTAAFRYIKGRVPGPFVFIFTPFGAIEKRVNMKRLEVGVRIPGHPIPIGLVKTLGHPMFAITASRQMSEEGWWDAGFAEEQLFESGSELEDLPLVDMVIDGGEALAKELSTVVSLKEGSPVILRQGIGQI